MVSRLEGGLWQALRSAGASPIRTVAVCLALLASSRHLPVSAAGVGVRSDNLPSLVVPGRVDAVVWTQRLDACTLQVVFPNAAGIGKDRRERPQVQVWLLSPDGSVIAPLRRMDVGPKDLRRPFGVEVSFTFPLAAATSAAAVAIQVDGTYRAAALPKALP